MKVKLYRFDPSKDETGYFDEYEVPVPKDVNWTVMDVLDYILLNIDSSISYFKHSACYHGICGRCVLRVNGKPKLACLCIANEYDELVLEPRSKKNVVKDLVTKVP